MNTGVILNTAYISLAVQILTAIIGIYGIMIPISAEKYILRELLIMETIVQFIEMVYYFWLIQNYQKINYDVTFTRYFDWSLSTPIMFINTAMFMQYKNSTQPQSLRLWSMIMEYANPVFWILMANWIMLLFGYLGERKVLSRTNAFLGGTVMFLYSFFYLYSTFVGDAMINRYLFWVMLVIWFMYGIAFCFSYETKNAFYNILDLFSKNFYELFLVYQIRGK